MKKSFLLVVAIFFIPNFAYCSIGFSSLIDSSEEARPLILSIWYPTNDNQSDIMVGGNAVFHGESAAVDAQVTGRHPLVVISHGGLRSTNDSGAWLSATLAKAGFIVIEVNAPRPESPVVAVNEIWQRPRDISRALSVILDSPVWVDHIDQKKVFVVGFALGGTAALFISGAILDANNYFQSCDNVGTVGTDCAWYSSHNVALSQVSQSEFKQPKYDYRFNSAVLIDPEYLESFSSDSRLPSTPTLLISLDSKKLETIKLPQVEKKIIDKASSLDAFAVCTEKGAQILLEEEGDATLCGVSSEARARAHTLITNMVLSFLTRRL